MKKAVSLLLVLVLTLGLVACGKGSDGKTAKGSGSDDEMTGELRITVQAWMMGKYDFDGMKETFEKNHPGVTVVYNKVDNFDTTTNMLQWAQGKTNCDIAIGGSREHAVQYAAQDYIVEFEDDFFTGDYTRDKFFDAFLELGNIEGTQYMIPFTGELMFIVANKQLMIDAGVADAEGVVPAPATWDDLYGYAEAATVVTDGRTEVTGLTIDWGTNFMTYAYLASLQGIQGTYLSEDGRGVDFSSDNSTYLLEQWQNLVSAGYTPTDTFADMDAGRTNFKAGKVAMLMTAASRWVETMENLGPDSTTLIPIPGTEENGSLVYIHGVVIPKVSPKIELAKLFIKEALLDDELHIEALNTYGKMSPLMAHYDNLENPDWPLVVETTKNATTPPLYRDYAKMDNQIQIELQKCITGDQSVQDTQANLQKLAEELDFTTGLKD